MLTQEGIGDKAGVHVKEVLTSKAKVGNKLKTEELC